jgi:hypothetical protein
MADRDDHSDDERPGYKRPPSWGQIQKGERRNPNGRPKGTGKKLMASKAQPAFTELEKLLAGLLGEEVLLTLNGKKESVTKKRAILLNLFKQAMSGTPVALRELNRLTEKLEAKEQAAARAEAEAQELVAKEKAKQDEACYHYLVDLKETQSRAWQGAAAEGRLEPERPWPHPDDVLIDNRSRTGRVRGPVDASSVRDWEHCCRVRDHFLARYVLAVRTDDKCGGLAAKIWLAGLYNEDLQLPLRWQITHDLWAYSRQLHCMSLRKLEAIVADGAAEFEGKRLGGRRSRETYQLQNRMYGPVIKLMGYGSLKQFERACEG